MIPIIPGSAMALLNLLRGAAQGTADAVAPIRANWRVTVYVNGQAQYYGDTIHEGAADMLAREWRAIYAEEKMLGVFVKKERIIYHD